VRRGKLKFELRTQDPVAIASRRDPDLTFVIKSISTALCKVKNIDPAIKKAAAVIKNINRVINNIWAR
jgi:hypothetical protein